MQTLAHPLSKSRLALSYLNSNMFSISFTLTFLESSFSTVSLSHRRSLSLRVLLSLHSTLLRNGALEAYSEHALVKITIVKKPKRVAARAMTYTSDGPAQTLCKAAGVARHGPWRATDGLSRGKTGGLRVPWCAGRQCSVHSSLLTASYGTWLVVGGLPPPGAGSLNIRPGVHGVIRSQRTW